MLRGDGLNDGLEKELEAEGGPDGTNAGSSLTSSPDPAPSSSPEIESPSHAVPGSDLGTDEVAASLVEADDDTPGAGTSAPSSDGTSGASEGAPDTDTDSPLSEGTSPTGEGSPVDEPATAGRELTPEEQEENEPILTEEELVKVEGQIDEWERQRDTLNFSAEDHRAARDQLNDRTKALIKEREKWSNEIRANVKIATDAKEERNRLNVQVKEAKVEREALNNSANALMEKVQALRQERTPTEGPSPHVLKRDLRELERKMETSVLSAADERKIVDQIKKLAQHIRTRENALESDDKVHAALTEARAAAEKAEESHRSVSELAANAQRNHDLMVKHYGLSDLLRKDLERVQRELSENKSKADEEHKAHIDLIHQVHDLDKISQAARRRARRTTRAKREERAKTKASDLISKFKKGGKLSTEDLMALQNKG